MPHQIRAFSDPLSLATPDPVAVRHEYTWYRPFVR